MSESENKPWYKKLLWPTLSALCGGVLVAFVKDITSNREPEYYYKWIKSEVQDVPPGVWMVFPEDPKKTARYGEFLDRFQAKHRTTLVKNRIVRDLEVKVLSPLDSSYDQSASELARRLRGEGNVKYVLCVGTGVAQAMSRQSIPQRMLALLVTDETVLTPLERDKFEHIQEVGGPSSYAGCILLASHLGKLLSNDSSLANDQNLCIVRAAGEESSNAVRRAVRQLVRNGTLSVPVQFHCGFGDEEASDILDGVCVDDVDAFIVLHDRVMLGMSRQLAEVIAKHHRPLVTSCEDDAAFSSGSIATASFGYAYSDLGSLAAMEFKRQLMSGESGRAASASPQVFADAPSEDGDDSGVALTYRLKATVHYRMLKQLGESAGVSVPTPAHIQSQIEVLLKNQGVDADTEIVQQR